MAKKDLAESPVDRPTPSENSGPLKFKETEMSTNSWWLVDLAFGLQRPDLLSIMSYGRLKRLEAWSSAYRKRPLQTKGAVDQASRWVDQASGVQWPSLLALSSKMALGLTLLPQLGTITGGPLSC